MIVLISTALQYTLFDSTVLKTRIKNGAIAVGSPVV